MKWISNIGNVVFIICFFTACNSSRSSEQSKKSQVLKVMSYNIHHANPPSKPNVIDIEAIARVINEQKPDLVALQEIDVNTMRSGKTVNEAEEIARLTGMTAYFAKTIDYQGGEYGIGILSKYKMEDMANQPLPTAEGTNGEPRALATAIINLPGNRKILFASTHLEAGLDTNRVLQINRILEVLKKEALPVIIGGDFNSRPESKVINLLDSYFTRSCISECPFTIPVNNPRATIDYIAYAPSSSFKVLEHQVIDEKYASDHLPVLVIFEMK